MISNAIYWIIIELYELAISLYAVTNKKAKKLRKGRKNWETQILEAGDLKSSKVAWVHCASLGEFEQAKPVIASLKAEISDLQVGVSFFSPSGYEIRKNDPLVDLAFYLPKDSSKNAKKLFEIIRPSFVIIIKYEFWKNLLEEGKRRDIPIYLVSGIFRKQQAFFKWYGALHRKMLGSFKFFFLQNEDSKRLLKSIGIDNSVVSGDSRFDQVTNLTNVKFESEIFERFQSGHTVFIAGSAWEEDLRVIIPLINDSQHLRFIIAPHEIDPKRIENFRRRIQKQTILYSEVNKESLADVIIMDSIGLLSKIYRFGDIGFIGGAYGPGLHNTLEAVAYGLPVFFGNRNYVKYQEAIDLIDLGIGIPIDNSSELGHEVNRLLADENLLRTKKDKATQYVKSKVGSTEIITSTILKHFEGSSF